MPSCRIPRLSCSCAALGIPQFGRQARGITNQLCSLTCLPFLVRDTQFLSQGEFGEDSSFKAVATGEDNCTFMGGMVMDRFLLVKVDDEGNALWNWTVRPYVVSCTVSSNTCVRQPLASSVRHLIHVLRGRDSLPSPLSSHLGDSLVLNLRRIGAEERLSLTALWSMQSISCRHFDMQALGCRTSLVR